MEEERQQIEALLSQQPSRRPASLRNGRSPSPYVNARSPVRSMLDIGGPPTKHSPTQAHTQVRSMLDIDSPVPAAATPVRSMLDIGGTPSPAVPKSPAVSSAQTSPTLSTHRVPAPSSEVHIRSMSDATTKPVLDFGPRSPAIHRDRNVDPTSAYKFSDIYATNVGQARPGTRIAQPSRSSSIGEALRGSDLSNLVLPGEFGRTSFSLRGKSKSKSPSNRFNLRSNSPHGSLLGRSSSRSQANNGTTIMLEDGQIIDKNSAYRRLSDANLIYGGSSLSSLPRKKSDPDGHGRIEKLNMSPYGEILTDDDSEDDVGNSSDEENHRGRKLTPRGASRGSDDPSRAAKSLLAAAEDESMYFQVLPKRLNPYIPIPGLVLTAEQENRLPRNISTGPCSTTPRSPLQTRTGRGPRRRRSARCSLPPVLTNPLNPGPRRQIPMLIRTTWKIRRSRVLRTSSSPSRPSSPRLMFTDPSA